MNSYTDMAKMEDSRNCLRRIARHDDLQFSKESIVNVMEKFVKTVNIMDETILVPCRLMDRQVGDSTDIVPAPGKDCTANQLTLSSNAHGKRSASNSKNVHEFLNSSELFNLYTMLNSLKNELLWTGKDETAEADLCNYEREHSQNVHVTPEQSKSETTTSQSNVTAKGHNRRPSTASVASTASVSNMSDAESDISNENDSGVESDGHKNDNLLQSSDGSISSSDDALDLQKKKATQDKATELARRCKRHLSGLYQCLEQMTEAANYLSARYQSDIGPV